MLHNSILMRLLRNEHGATAIEYGLIASLLVVAIVGALNNFGDGASNMWNRVSNDTHAAVEKST